MIESVNLSNGLKIVLEPINFVRSISCGIWVKNGSRNESEDINGISHFIEHMLFKGTNKRNAKQIAEEMDFLGGQINAFTSKECTCYYIKTLDTNFDEGFDILADMFLNSKFDNKEIKKECSVIKEEINMYEDTPDELANDLLQYNIWENDSLGLPILGTKETISTFNTNTFKNYYKKNYCADNIVISVAGNFISDDMIKKIQYYFGDLNSKLDRNDIYNTKYKPCIVKKEKDIEQINLILGFEGINREIKQIATMAIFNSIFGNGMSSRLFQNIREDKGLVYSIYSYNVTYQDTGLFCIYAAMNKDNTENTIKNIMKEIKNLDSNLITQDQFMKAKQQVKSSFLLNLESSSSRMNTNGKNQILLNRIYTTDEMIEIVNSINIEDLYSLIHKVFNIEKMSICAVGNIDNIDFEGCAKNEF